MNVQLLYYFFDYSMLNNNLFAKPALRSDRICAEMWVKLFSSDLNCHVFCMIVLLIPVWRHWESILLLQSSHVRVISFFTYKIYKIHKATWRRTGRYGFRNSNCTSLLVAWQRNQRLHSSVCYISSYYGWRSHYSVQHIPVHRAKSEQNWETKNEIKIWLIHLSGIESHAR